MFGTFSSCMSVLRMGPRTFLRQRLKLPLVKFIHDTVDLYKQRTKSGVNNIREILFRGTVIALITALLVWLSIFMYIAFYYTYIPATSHERPVHLEFKHCDKDCGLNKGLCSFPSAHISLTKNQQLLMHGQSYKIHLELEMPESPTNRELGMFMVCADFRSDDGSLIAHSCRSTMIHYKSFLLDTLYKLIFCPFFVFGASEEKQHLHVELFSDYQENEKPVKYIFVEIQSMHIEIYSAKFLINAHFSGLRFLMYNWPIFSAAIGITSNLFFIALVCMISWHQIINSDEYLDYIENAKEENVYPYYPPELLQQLRDGDPPYEWKNEVSDSSSSSSPSVDVSEMSDMDEKPEMEIRKRETRQFVEDIKDSETNC